MVAGGSNRRVPTLVLPIIFSGTCNFDPIFHVVNASVTIAAYGRHTVSALYVIYNIFYVSGT